MMVSLTPIGTPPLYALFFEHFVRARITVTERLDAHGYAEGAGGLLGDTVMRLRRHNCSTQVTAMRLLRTL